MWMGEWVVISLNGGWEGWFWNSCCLTDAQTPSPTPLGSVSKKPWELDVSLRWVWGGEGHWTGQRDSPLGDGSLWKTARFLSSDSWEGRSPSFQSGVLREGPTE